MVIAMSLNVRVITIIGAGRWVRIRAEGPTGHGSRFVPHTATQKLLRVADKITAFHESQVNRF
jgi:acetylornithine deacetylase/succinyl-diaminopimelate desuccinylase-like protein